MSEANLVLSELLDSDVQKLLSSGVIRSYKAGDVLISEANESPSLFILLSGSIEVLAGTSLTQLATLYPGELVGEMSFIDKRKSSAVVRTLEPSEALEITRAEVERILAEDDGLAARFFRGVARLVVRRLRSTITHLSTGEKPQQRVEVQLDYRLLEKVQGKKALSV